jgi:hypothetical protein
MEPRGARAATGKNNPLQGVSSAGSSAMFVLFNERTQAVRNHPVTRQKPQALRLSRARLNERILGTTFEPIRARDLGEKSNFFGLAFGVWRHNSRASLTRICAILHGA